MKYPKAIMSISELVEMGYPRGELRKLVHAWDQNFAVLTSGEGKWLIDTERFDKYMTKRRNQSGRMGI